MPQSVAWTQGKAHSLLGAVGEEEPEPPRQDANYTSPVCLLGSVTAVPSFSWGGLSLEFIWD